MLAQIVMPSSVVAQSKDRLLLTMACILLGVCFITGGSSQQTNLGVMLAQLLAIPVLFYALWEAQRRGCLVQMRWSVVLFALIVSIPLMQLLPLPEWLWSMPPARQSLQHDLSEAGLTTLQYRWSLIPGATERDLLSLLPAAALFFAGLTLGAKARRRLFWFVIALSFFSLVLGVAQIGAGQYSILNPFPQWVPALGGVFANANHQAAAIAIALVLAIALLLDSRSRIRRGENLQVLPWILGALITTFVLAIPMIGSRAGPIIAIMPVIIFVVSSGLFSFDRVRHHRGVQIALLFATLALVLGIHAALSFTTGDKIDSIRATLTKQTVLIGFTHAPLGGGIGGFVPLYDQGVDASLLRDEYINNAHNEYAQLWLEGGAIAMACMLAVFGWLALSFRRLLALRAKSSSRRRGLAAAAAMFVIILHSSVDYPLRTPALMGVFALMAGILAANASMAREASNSANATQRGRETESPQAGR
jgi:O-antigen ligase